MNLNNEYPKNITVKQRENSSGPQYCDFCMAQAY